MTEEVKAKSRVGNRTLLITLGVLVLVIVGLVIGIFIARANLISKDDNNSRVSTGETVNDEVRSEDAFSEEVISQFIANGEVVDELNDAIEPMTADEAEEYLRQQREESTDTSTQQQITLMMIWVYVNDYRPQEALTISNEIEENNLSERQKLQYYEVMAKIYDGLADQAASQEYHDKWLEQYRYIFGDGGEF